MASPLGWFRRHQKGMMVVFGMVLMAIFGLGSVAMMITPGQGSNNEGNEKAVQWNGGSLTKAQVENMRIRHFLSMRFLNGVRLAAQNKKKDNFYSAALPIEPIASESNLNTRQADFAIAQRFLLAEKARREGILVNDAMVNDYISLVHNEVPMTEQELEVINREVNGEYVDLIDIRRHLKMELAAQQYGMLLNAGIPRVPNPMEAAELYSQLETQIDCAVLPLNVEDFVSKVTEEPSNSELKKLFKEGQYQLENSRRDSPGFKLGNRVQVQFLSANYNDFLEAEKAKVSDEEVKKKYDEFVADENPMVMEDIPVEERAIDATGDGTENQGTGADGGSDLPPAPPTGAGDSGDAAPKPGEATQNNAETSDDKKSEKSEENSEGKSSEKKDETNSDDKKDDPEQAQVLLKNAEYVSTSVQDEKKQEKQEESKDDKNADASQENKEQGSDDPKMLDDQTQGADSAAKQGSDEPEMLEGNAAKQDEELPKTKRPRPLDESLASMIRERIVGATPFENMQTQIRTAEAEVSDYQIDYTQWEALPDEERLEEDKPAPLDVKALADKLQMRFGETDLLNFREMLESDFGKRIGLVSIPSRFGNPRNDRRMMGVIVFSGLDRRIVYDPSVVAEEFTRTNIVWWLSEKKDMEVLKFAEAKDKVIRYWKLQKARELARAEAIKIANDLNSSKKKLMDVYPNTAKLTGNFTWFQSTGYSNPTEVEGPGKDFMSTAFGLDVLECGGALNDEGNFAYVIQKITQDQRDLSELSGKLLNDWATFQQLPFNVSDIGRRKMGDISAEARQKLNDELDFKWLAD